MFQLSGLYTLPLPAQSLTRTLQGGNTAVIKKQVQQQFKRNATETDATKVLLLLLRCWV